MKIAEQIKKVKELMHRAVSLTDAELGAELRALIDDGPKVRPRFIPPTLPEVVSFFRLNGYSEEGAVEAFKYYEESNPPWHDSQGNQVLSWKSKMRANWFRLKYKIHNVNRPTPSINNHIDANNRAKKL